MGYRRPEVFKRLNTGPLNGQISRCGREPAGLRCTIGPRLIPLLAIVGTLTCDGGAGTDPVVEPNRGPQPVGTIPGRQLFSGDTVALDVAEFFHDQDGDNLTHSASSLHPEIVQVSVSGSVVTLRAVSQGTANVTVTATDPGGLSAQQSFEVAVPGRGPETVGTIADLVLEVGSTATIGLQDYFADPDGDSLDFTAMSSDTAVATVVVGGDSVRITALAKGAATIAVTARDPAGLEAGHGFAVSVPNRGPVVTDMLPRRLLEVGDTLRVDLSDHFSDPDGDALSFMVVSSNTSVVETAVAEEILAIVAVDSDSAAITVSATDTDGLSIALEFTVVVANRAPEAVGTIPGRQLFSGDTVALDVGEYFHDQDGGHLTHYVTSSHPEIVQVSVSGSVVTLRAVSQGTANVTVAATDPGGLSAQQSFEVTVPNRGPEAVETIADLELGVGSAATIRLQNYFSDPDDDSLSFAAVSSDTVAVTVLVAGDSVRITALAKGTATIAVTARDPTGLEARHAFAVTVPNRGPVVTDMLPRRLLEVGDTLEVDLSGHFSDPDGDALSYMAASSNTSVVEAAIAGEILAIVALNSDSATIIVSATDTDGLSIARDFTIMIVNRAPEAVDTTPDLTLTEGDTAVLDLSAHFRDPDGDTLSYAAESSREIRVKVAVTGDSLILVAETAGSSTISVTARDAGGLSATQRFRAVVEPIPVPDLVVDTPTVDADSVEVGGEFTLSAVVRNQGDGDATSSTTLRFFHYNPRITPTDSLLGTFPVRPLNTAERSVGSFIAQAPTAAGTYYYGACVGALDNESDAGNNCSGAVHVRVWQPNRAPRPVGTIPLQEVPHGDSSLVNLTGYFRDPDGDPLSFAAMSSDTGIAVAAVAGGVVIVRPRFRGTATVTVTAVDPSGLSAWQEFEVSVPNRGPEATGVVDEQQLHVGDSVTIGVSVYFTDPEGDTLSYAAESSREIRVKVAVTGDSLILVAETAGSSTISVTARDAGGLSATQRFRAVVEPIPVPDLVVGTPTVDADSVEVGGEFTLSAVVRNQGEGKATSSTTLRFFHSDNPRITTSDSLLGTYPVGQLDTAATSVGSLMVLAPTAAGTYYYGACVGALDNESDTGNNCSGAVRVRVWQPNRAPRPVGTIPLQEVPHGDSSLVNLTGYFRDPDGDPLSFAAMSSDTGIAVAAVAGGVVIVRPRFRGTATVTVTATDPSGLSARQEFEVSVPNRGPEATGVVDEQQLHVGDSVTIGVSVYFTDPEGDTLAFSAESSDSSAASAGVAGDSLRLVALAVGTANVTVTARDPAGEAAVQRFRAVVEPVPVPDLVVENPMVDTDSVKVEGEFTLSAMVRNQGNAESQSSTLRFYESSDATIASDDNDVGTGSVLPLGADQASDVSIQVTGPSDVGTRYYGACVDAPATETNTGNNCSAGIPVRFRPPNHKPEPGDRFRAQAMEPGHSVRIGLSRFFTDPDGDSLRYTATSSDPAIATVSVRRDAIIIEAKTLGSTTIAVTAQDVTTHAPSGLTATQEFEVTVRLRPRPDLVVDLPQDSFAIGPDQSFLLNALVRNEGSADAATTLLRLFLSSDTTISTADSEVGSHTVGTVPVSGTATATTQLTSPATEGTYYYGACVDAVAEESKRDNNCSRAVTVVVDELKPPNRAPETPGGFEDIDDARPGQRYQGSLAEVFSDPDGDPLTYAASSSDDAIAYPEIVGDVIYVHAVAAGTATITVTATDPGGLSASTDFAVTIGTETPISAFSIKFGFTGTVTEGQKTEIRAAVGAWEAILAGTELPDVDLGDGFKCVNLVLPDGTQVDDHLFIAHVWPIDGPGGTLASAGFCEQREGSGGFPTVSRAVFDAADIDVLVAEGMLADVAFHELAHGLGFIGGHLESLGLIGDGTDPHFTGSGARAAFNAAGGASYTGAKVPIEPDHDHWRESVFDVEVMTPLIERGVPQPVSAITLRAFADLGYSVNVGLASSYTLPGPRPPLAARGQPRRVFNLSGDVAHGPVTIRGPDGRVVDVIPPPPGYAPLPGPFHKVTIDRPSEPVRTLSLYVSWIREPPARPAR